MKTEGTRGKEAALTRSGRGSRCVEKRGKTQRSLSLSFIQESGEFAEDLHARTVPL